MTYREKMIHALETVPVHDGVIRMSEEVRDKIVELLKEQKQGHWKGFTQSRYYGNDDDGEPIFRDGRFYVCSECRRKTVIKTQFCPRCGAMMNGVNQHDQETQAETHQADHPVP